MCCCRFFVRRCPPRRARRRPGAFALPGGPSLLSHKEAKETQGLRPYAPQGQGLWLGLLEGGSFGVQRGSPTSVGSLVNHCLVI